MNKNVCVFISKGTMGETGTLSIIIAEWVRKKMV